MIRVALSFDNGPDPDITPRVLDVLAARQLQAYFFVIGRQIATREGREVMVRARAEGHIIGNHSFTHQTPLGDDPRPDAVALEIESTERLIGSLAAAPKLFRPFGGGGVIGPHLLSEAALQYLERERYTCVLWSSVPRDWDDPEGWVARALDPCTPDAHVLLVLHDIPGACDARLAEFLDIARDRGVRFVTELPDACVPLIGGERRGDLTPLVRWSAVPSPRVV